MRFMVLAAWCIVLSACVAQQEVWNRNPGFSQAELDHDYQECSNLADATPNVWHDTDVYSSRSATIGNTTTTTTGPDPCAAAGQAIADRASNDSRKTAIRRYCMNSKGYKFAGMRDVPSQ